MFCSGHRTSQGTVFFGVRHQEVCLCDTFGPVHGHGARVLKWSTSFSAGDTIVDGKLLSRGCERAADAALEPFHLLRAFQGGADGPGAGGDGRL